MRQLSHRTPAAKRRRFARFTLLVGVGLTAFAQALSAQTTADPPAAAARLNPTGRDITLSAPLRDGEFLLGEVQFVLAADDQISVETSSFLAALRPVLEPARLAALETQLGGLAFTPVNQLIPFGLRVRYDPAVIGLVVDIPPDARIPRDLSVARFGDPTDATFIEPATISGYINFRTFADYTWSGADQGFRAPSSLIESAIRYKRVVLENEATLDFESDTRGTFIREGTRLVYDDRDRLVRFTAGDQLPIGRGFVGSSQIFGLGAQRVYSIVDPLRQVQPRGDRSFTLTRPSTVQTLINGQEVRRVRLDPGTYNVSDFPFVQGTNNVDFIIEDDAGGRQTLSFSQFFDRTLLQPGLTEFAVYAGIFAPFGRSSRDYQFDELAASGWFRRGIRDNWTAGANFNVRDDGAAIGAESVLATGFGTLGTDLAVSTVDGVGTGLAANVGIQRTFGGYGTRARSVAASVEYRSKNFAIPGSLAAFNRFAWSLSGSYSQSIGERQFVSLSGNYQMTRGLLDDEYSARATYGYSINSRYSLTLDAVYEDRNFFGREYGVRATLLVRLGPRSTGVVEVDTRTERARLGYQTSHGEGVGSYSLSADVEAGFDSVGANGGINYIANRAELGVNHTTIYDFDGQNIDSQRTSLRFSTAVAFADGKFAMSRPIFDSFAMVAPHRSLDDADVYIDPRGEYYSARSGALGPAVDPDLSAYIARTITYDVPNAPVGYDLGTGSARVMPPYRGGYLITAGSDYSVTAIGTLFGANGEPVSLLAGRATELGVDKPNSVTIFTNRSGRFGMTGLRAGRWRIDMPTEPPTSAIIEIPEGELGVVRLSDVRLGEPK